MIDTRKRKTGRPQHLPPTRGLNVTIEPKIHNRFDIWKRNVETGVEEQVAYAENIVLNQMFTRLCGFSTYFSHIRYGTGTGTLAVTRTSLFTDLGYKAVTSVEKIYAVPTSSWRQSIELGLTDNNGAVLTEVGIAYGTGSTNLVTHAMLRDMNGNPVSITKTSVDILTIYATVYFTLDNSHASLKMLHPIDNVLIAYLMGGSAPAVTCMAGDNPDAIPWPGRVPGNNGYGGSTTGSWVADAGNKRVTLQTPRFQVDSGNGNITEIFYNHIARLLLPASGIYAGLDLTGVTVGAGDGLVSVFDLPSKNVRDTGLVVKIDGATITAFTKALALKTPHSLGKPVALPSSQWVAACISDNGLVFACRTYNTSFVYDNIDGTWLARTNPVLTAGNNPDISLSADGAVLCSGDKVLDWTGTAWTTRPLPTADASIMYGFISGNGLVYAAALNGSPRLNVFDWNGTAWTKRPNISLPAVTIPWASMTANGSRLMLRGDSWVKTYDWDGSAWVNPQSITLYSSDRGYISLAGLFIVCNGSSVANVYAYSGGAWALREAVTPGGSDVRAGLSEDGAHLMLLSSTGMHFYIWSGTAYVKQTNDFVLSTGTAYNLHKARSADIWLVYGSSYNIILYKTIAKHTRLTFTTPPGLVTAEAVGTGDGSDATWDLDHTPIGGSLTVYLDGAPTTAYTLGGSTITFNTAPGVGVAITADYRYACAITADYTVDGIHKTTTRVIDVTFTIQFGIPA